LPTAFFLHILSADEGAGQQGKKWGKVFERAGKKGIRKRVTLSSTAQAETIHGRADNTNRSSPFPQLGGGERW